MGLGDLFSTSFLISLGITLLLVGFLGIFLTQKIMEQNHKISSMMGLVTTMAEELNYMRARIQMIGGVPGTMRVPNPNLSHGSESHQEIELNPSLIPVSDNEDEEDSDEYDSQSESDSDSDREDDTNNEEESITSADIPETFDLENKESNIKIINMGETMNIAFESLEEMEKDEDEDDKDSLSNSEEDIESVESESLDQENGNDNKTATFTDLKSQIKTISIPIETEEKLSELAVADIKKMSISQLRAYASQLGILEDVSKIKKAELVKLVETKRKEM